MKKIVLGLLLISMSLLASDVYVNGYTRSNGTYVESYHRSSPDSIKENNYGYKGF